MAFELKRFWDAATAAPAENGFAVLLDGRPLKTPLKKPVVLPSQTLAELVAAEWQLVEGKVDKRSMPFTKLTEAALDAAKTEYKEIVANLAAYGGTDLLCYRAEAPAELVARQAQHWDPILGWAASELKAPLQPTQSIIAIDQSVSSLKNLQNQIERFDLFQLTAFYDLVKLSGSLIIAFAVERGHIAPKLAWEISRVDDNWQIEQWGVDDEAAALAQSKWVAFESAYRMMKSLNAQ